MRQFTIERAAVLILFGLLFALAARVPVDSDTWWHLRSGEYTLTHGMIYSDPFSFTKDGAAWINHSWGAQIILYGIWRVAGNIGLALYVAGAATAGMFAVYKMSSGTVYLRAFALIIGAATAAVFWSARPQMLSFALSAWVLYLLQAHKRGGVDRLWLIPIIMGIWGNLHAGFSIGFIFLFGSIAGEVMNNLFRRGAEGVVNWRGVRKLVIITSLSVVALVINPYGLEMLKVPFQTVGIGALQDFIQEWNSPNFHERQTWAFVILLLGLLGAAGASRKGWDWTDYFLVGGTAFMSLLAGRNIAVFAVVATPQLTAHLDAFLTQRGWIIRPARFVSLRMARLNVMLTVLVLAGALLKVALVLHPAVVQDGQEEFLPVRVTAYLKDAQWPGPMFNSYNWGGYLLFALPEQPVFVDGRTDLYGDDFLSNVYIPAAAGRPGWDATLDRYGIRLVVVEPQSGLARVLRVRPEWVVRYEDEQAVVFTREGGA